MLYNRGEMEMETTDTLTRSINVRITEELDDAIKEQARIQQRKPAQLIRLTLERVFLKEKEGEADGKM